MMKLEEQSFIEKYIVKSGEQLNSIPTSLSNDYLTDIQIVKKTERTFRIVGLLTLSKYQNKSGPAEDDLLKANLTPTKKIHWNDHDPNTIRWFEQGWIMKEIRFKKDGRTPESQHYRMGFRLYQYLQDLQRVKENEWELELNQIKSKFILINPKPSFPISEQRENGIKTSISVINELFTQDAPKIQNSHFFPTHWPMTKKIKFLHFIVAFLQICLQKMEFDWKEIGASYFKEIGGSKEFDQNKDEFIEILEEQSQCPAALLGLTSLGKITPLYFSGPLTGKFSSYSCGPVHALTDLSISQEQYFTSATTLWLVENRAILTRIASEKQFLYDTHSLILCIDGHLRSSHKQCIIQLLKNSTIEQAIIWTDYDPDGLQISKEIYETIIETTTNLQSKWITADQEVLVSWQDYQLYMQAFLKIKKMEQEEVLGGADVWKNWVRH